MLNRSKIAVHSNAFSLRPNVLKAYHELNPLWENPRFPAVRRFPPYPLLRHRACPGVLRNSFAVSADVYRDVLTTIFAPKLHPLAAFVAVEKKRVLLIFKHVLRKAKY